MATKKVQTVIAKCVVCGKSRELWEVAVAARGMPTCRCGSVMVEEPARTTTEEE